MFLTGVGRRAPRERHFFFAGAFFFVPRGGAPEIALRSKDVLGIPVLPQRKKRLRRRRRGQCRRLFILNRTRSPEGSDRKTYGRGDPSPTVV